MILLAWAACRAPVPDPLEGATSIEAVWAKQVAVGALRTFGPLEVISGRTSTDDRFYARAPGGGAGSAVEIVLGDVLEDLPPPIGAPFTLYGALEAQAGDATPPRLRVFDEVSLDVTGEPVPLAADAYADDPALAGGLVTASNLTVTSRPDPAGHADGDPADLGGLFGRTPGWGRSGDLTGVLLDGRISARDDADWTGEWTGDAPVITTPPELAGLADGTPVELQQVVQATPWSRDGRLAVFQDLAGDGLWVDAESWDLGTVAGDQVTLIGEVRAREDGLVVRVWDSPALGGTGVAITDGDTAHGDVGRWTVSDLGAVDATGGRTSDAGPLDDVFLDLTDLGDPSEVWAAAQVDAAGVVTLCPFE